MTDRRDIHPMAPLQILGGCPEGMVLLLSPADPAHMRALAEFLLLDVNNYLMDRLAAYAADKRAKAAAKDEAEAERAEAALDSPEGEQAQKAAAAVLARFMTGGQLPN